MVDYESIAKNETVRKYFKWAHQDGHYEMVFTDKTLYFHEKRDGTNRQCALPLSKIDGLERDISPNGNVIKILGVPRPGYNCLFVRFDTSQTQEMFADRVFWTIQSYMSA